MNRRWHMVCEATIFHNKEIIYELSENCETNRFRLCEQTH